MDRRSFVRFLGAGAALAPAVKSAVTLPDHEPEKFAGAKAPRLDISAHMWDVRDGLLYDRVRFEPGQRIPGVLRFFAVPMGQICYLTNKRKTERDTNMHSAGMLPPPQQFLAQRVLFAVHPSANQADIDTISSECAWEFQVLCKIMMTGPMLLNGPARAGLRDIVGPDGTARDPLPDEVLATARHNPLTTGIFIPAQCNFSFKLETPENQIELLPASKGGRGLDLMIALQGARTLPVC